MATQSNNCKTLIEKIMEYYIKKEESLIDIPYNYYSEMLEYPDPPLYMSQIDFITYKNIILIKTKLPVEDVNIIMRIFVTLYSDNINENNDYSIDLFQIIFAIIDDVNYLNCLTKDKFLQCFTKIYGIDQEFDSNIFSLNEYVFNENKEADDKYILFWIEIMHHWEYINQNKYTQSEIDDENFDQYVSTTDHEFMSIRVYDYYLQYINECITKRKRKYKYKKQIFELKDINVKHIENVDLEVYEVK